jgi:hypothetical protein
MKGLAKIVKLLEFRFNRLVINENKDLTKYLQKIDLKSTVEDTK